MAGKTHLDELVDYKQIILNELRNSQTLIGLITNNPNIDMDSDEAFEAQEEQFFDYAYIDGTLQEAKALIMVEVEMLELSSSSFKTMNIYVQPVCNKSYMRLDGSLFKGVKGNRLDNICREIDLVLRGRRDIGVGRLQLTAATLASTPDKFTSRMLTYQAPDFAYSRRRLND